MRVCHVTTVHQRFDPRIYIKECQSLASSGYDVFLIVADGKGNKFEKKINIMDAGKSNNRLSRVLMSGFRAYKIAKDINAEIYHFHDLELVILGIMLKLRGKKVIYDVHEDNYTSLKQKKYLPKIFRNTFAIFTLLIDFIASKLFYIIIAEKYYEKRFPISTKVLNYPKKIDGLESNRNFSKSNLIYTGNITFDRGAIEMARLVQSCRSIKIVCIGKCKKKVATEMYKHAQHAKDRLIIIGIDRYVPFCEIVSQYVRDNWIAGIALFPPTEHYRKKELTKIFEYMAAGLPIICSNFPTWKKLIENNNVGITVDPYDTYQICEKIKYLKNNKNISKSMGEMGKKLVRKTISWEKEEQNLLCLYDRIIKRISK